MRNFGWSTSICQGTYLAVPNKSRVGVDFFYGGVGDKKILVQVGMHTQSCSKVLVIMVITWDLSV